MGVSLEIGKMFFYIMIPIGFFHYYSHQDPEYYRKMRENHESDLIGNAAERTQDYARKRAVAEFQTDSYNSTDAFWRYGIGLKVKQEMEEKVKQM